MRGFGLPNQSIKNIVSIDSLKIRKSRSLGQSVTHIKGKKKYCEALSVMLYHEIAFAKWERGHAGILVFTYSSSQHALRTKHVLQILLPEISHQQALTEMSNTHRLSQESNLKSSSSHKCKSRFLIQVFNQLMGFLIGKYCQKLNLQMSPNTLHFQRYRDNLSQELPSLCMWLDPEPIIHCDIHQAHCVYALTEK